METNGRFQDRISENPNRRKLTIISQSPNTIVADIERADVVTGSAGTPINSTILNEWDTVVADAGTKSSQAFIKASDAETNATDAKQLATEANELVNSLISQPDCSMANEIGTPSVELVSTEDGHKFRFKNLKGESGEAAHFNCVTATAVKLETGVEPYATVEEFGPDTNKKFSFEFGMPKGIQGPSGEKGDSLFVRYSFDKSSMTEDVVDNTMYVGFYRGLNASTNPSDYSWSRFWGAESITEDEYKAKLSNGEINQEQIYFVKGSEEESVQLAQNAQEIGYSNETSNLQANNVQSAIDEIKSMQINHSYNDLTDKPVIPENSSFTLQGLSEKSYESLTEKPFIPSVDLNSIAIALGLTSSQLQQLIELAKITTVSGSESKEINFNVSSLNIQ